MSTSDSYRNALIESLKDPDYASAYLETHLESDEYGFDLRLFKLALQQVLEALGSQNLTAEQYQTQAKELEDMLAKLAPDVINRLNVWLQALGLKLTVAVAAQTQKSRKKKIVRIYVPQKSTLSARHPAIVEIPLGQKPRNSVQSKAPES